MSRRPGLPVPFLVGIFSAVALGIAWGLVYFSMPAPPPAVALHPPAPVPEPLPTSPILPPPPSPTTANPPVPPAPHAIDPTPSPALPQEKPESAPPPAVVPIAPAPVQKAPKPSLPRPLLPMAEGPSTSVPFSSPANEVPALQGVSPICIVELEKLCEGTQPGGARRKCFKDNEDKLSPACQRQFDDMASRIKEDMQHFRTACAGDVKQFCADVHPGGGNVVQCLEENYKEVSEDCYQTLKRFKKMKAGRSL